MTRLDHNRARTALAKKAGVANADVTCVTIWGNHSNTQYPDFTNAKINGKPATEVITDRAWLENTFVPQMPEPRRGGHQGARLQLGAVGRQRRARSRQEPAARRRPPTTGSARPCVSKGEYGVPAGLVFGYPCRSDGKGNLTVVEGVKLDAFGKQKFQTTLKELLEEKEAVASLLPG